MTGTGHRLTGIGAAFIAAALLRMAGATEVEQLVGAVIAGSTPRIPDWIEISTFRNGVRTGTVIPHRTITHWPPLWLFIAWYAHGFGGLIAAGGVGVTVGALTHILGDAPNPMGIPWIFPHKRIVFGKKGWWRSGKNEAWIVMGYGLFGVWLWGYSARFAGGAT